MLFGINISNGKLTADFSIEIAPGAVIAFPHPEFASFSHNGLSVSWQYGQAMIENKTERNIKV
jgi:hypothetical protein